MNRSQMVAALAFAATVLLGPTCRTVAADPVNANWLALRPQSSLTGPYASYAPYGNRVGSYDHETSLKRAPATEPWPSPYGGLLRMASSLDANGEAWYIAEKGDRMPGDNGMLIPYVHEVVGSTPVPVPSEIFYVAFRWDYNFFPESTGNEIFGWAKLQVAPPIPGSPPGTLNPDLVLLESAVTTDDRGIIVGEYRVIPEPSTFVTMALGVGLVARRSRRMRTY